MSSKDLLVEVIGEVQYQNVINGLGAKIESPDGYTYNVRMINYRLATVTRKQGSHVENGMLRGADIYDVIASFVMAVRLNKVEWECGRIFVELPTAMPPRSLGIVSFLFEKVMRIFNGLARVPYHLMGLHKELLTEEDGVGILVVIYAVVPWLVFCVGWMVMTALGFKISSYVRSITTGYFLGWGIYWCYLSFRRWQIKWGGEVY